MKKWLERLNKIPGIAWIDSNLDCLIDAVSSCLGNRNTFIAFAIIAGAPLIYQRPVGILGWCSYVSQTVIQLLALSAITRVQQNESAKLMQLTTETHDTVMTELADLNELLTALHKKQCKEISRHARKNS